MYAPYVVDVCAAKKSIIANPWDLSIPFCSTSFFSSGSLLSSSYFLYFQNRNCSRGSDDGWGRKKRGGGGTKSIDALVARATGAAASSHPFVCFPPPIGKSDAFASHHTDFLFLFLSFPDLRECVCSVRHENCWFSTSSSSFRDSFPSFA